MDRIIQALLLYSIVSAHAAQIKSLKPGEPLDIVTLDDHEYVHLFGIGVNIAITVERPAQLNYDVTPYNIREQNGLLIAEGKISTFGVNDPEDNGVGAWGYKTGDNPYAPFCSLPIPIVGYYGLKQGQKVTIAFDVRQVECFLVDKGPSTYTHRLVDVCPSVCKRLRCETNDIVRIYIPKGVVVAEEKRCQLDRDGSLPVFGPDPDAIKLFIAAVLCAELECFPPHPACDEEKSKEIIDKAEVYAQYLSMFFIVTRRRKARKECPQVLDQRQPHDQS